MKLKEWMNNKGVSASELSAKASVPIACITRYLNRDPGRGLSPVTAAKISKATKGKVSINDLLFPDGIDAAIADSRKAS